MKKELPEKYLDIQPTILEVEDANRLVDDVLSFAESGNYEPTQIAETLVELIGRLSDRYAGFTPTASQRSFEWVRENFDLNNFELINASLTILMNTPSLQNAKSFVLSKLQESSNQKITDLLEDFCREVDEGI